MFELNGEDSLAYERFFIVAHVNEFGCVKRCAANGWALPQNLAAENKRLWSNGDDHFYSIAPGQRPVTEKGDAPTAEIMRFYFAAAAPGAAYRIDKRVKTDGDAQVLPHVFAENLLLFQNDDTAAFAQDSPEKRRRVGRHADKL